MELLQEMINLNEDTTMVNKLVETLNTLEERYIACIDATTQYVTEGELPPAKQQADSRLSASKRGLGLANKLKSGIHKARTMGNMNRARGDVNRVDTLMADMEDLSGKFEAARRGLGLVNKLAAGESKSKHAKRVMGNLNRIRAQLRRVEKQLAIV